MALYSSSWGRPLQGVSQQPPKTRSEGQATLQLNAVSTAVRGLYKRNGTHMVQNYQNPTIPKHSKYHSYVGSGGIEYGLVVEQGTGNIRILREGVQSQVVDGDAYTALLNPSEGLLLKTIADTTFILNKGVKPRINSTRSPAADKRIIINCQYADYGKTYSIFAGGVSIASYTTPDGSDAKQSPKVDTSYVTEQLFESFQEAATIEEVDLDCGRFESSNIPQYNACISSQEELQIAREAAIGAITSGNIVMTRDRNTLIITGIDGLDITTADGASGKDLITIAGRVSSVDKLPTVAPDGYVVEVTGTGSKAVSYFLRADSTVSDSIRWVETIAPSTSTGLDPNYMPRILTQDAGGFFSLSVAEWGERKVGSAKTAPDPSFIQLDEDYNYETGIPLTDIGLFQNRLFFLAGEAVVFSKSNEFFNFYRGTVQDELPDEPIDIYSDTDKNNDLSGHAILDGDLVFFSRNGQFLQSGEKPITPETANMRYVSTFESIPDTPPVAAGDVIFFAFTYGSFTGIREFFTDSIVATKKAVPVTDHVNRYIEGRARQLVASGSQNYLFVLAEPLNTVYVYQWLWQGDERVQSSWGKWVFPEGDRVEYIALEGDYLRLFIRTAKGDVNLEQIDLSERNYWGFDYQIKLDRATPLRFHRDDAGEWVAALPEWARLYKKDSFVILQGSECLDAGSIVDYSLDGISVDGTIIDGAFRTSDELMEYRAGSDDNVLEADCVIGLPYDFVYEPTMPFLRDSNGQIMDSDRLMLNKVSINYEKLGDIEVCVKNDYGVERNYSHNGRVLGKINNTVGLRENTGGSFTFPIRQQNDRVVFTITSSSPYEFQLRDMEWTGQFKQRGRRI